jgi:hypothetical protein
MGPLSFPDLSLKILYSPVEHLVVAVLNAFNCRLDFNIWGKTNAL